VLFSGGKGEHVYPQVEYELMKGEREQPKCFLEETSGFFQKVARKVDRSRVITPLIGVK